MRDDYNETILEGKSFVSQVIGSETVRPFIYFYNTENAPICKHCALFLITEVRDAIFKELAGIGE